MVKIEAEIVDGTGKSFAEVERVAFLPHPLRPFPVRKEAP
jgi:hypothetical protein